MSISVTFNGSTYAIPSPGQSSEWATALNLFLQALAAARPTTAISGTVTSGNAVDGTATSGNAVRGTATTGVGVIGLSTTGAAVSGISTLGYGVVAQGDTTTPNIAALRVVPQNAQPAGPNQVGDIYVTTAGLLKICTVAGSPGTWVSVGAQ